MRSDKDVQREIRTFAFQHSVASALGWPSDIYSYAKLGRFLDGWLFYGRKEGASGDDERVELAARQIEELSQTVFTFEAFQTSLAERFALLRQTPWKKVEDDEKV